MASYPRLVLQLAGVAAVLSVASPAMAAQSALSTGETNGTVTKTAPSAINRQASSGHRVAASNQYRREARISQVHRNLDCSGVWCGRQFVLMIGIAY
jgi:hypothetical protein